jgi:hypothetical protein
MNLFRGFFEGVAAGFASTVTETTPGSPAGELIEKCCHELGWAIHERPSAHAMCLNFKDPLVGIRRVLAGFGKEFCVAFTVFSGVCVPPQQFPLNVLGYLLKRNGQPFVGWEMCVADDGDVGFALNYCALTSGLRPPVFKLICETMLKEVHEFDAKMDKAGLLFRA